MRLNVAAVALALLLSSVAQAQVFNGSGFGGIPDGPNSMPPTYGPPRDVIFNVSGVNNTFIIQEVSFGASHTYVGDLRVTLIAPDGNSHLLFERTGATSATDFGSNSNLVPENAYRFADINTTNWWTAAVIGNENIPSTNARTVVSGGAGVSNPPPVTLLNASFASVAPNGTWRLRFEDRSPGDVGSVTAASLSLRSIRTVTKTADTNDGSCDVDCSLREALVAAQNGELINFSPLFDTPQVIDLETALPAITRSISMQGPGAHLLTVRRSHTATTDFRVFDVLPGITNGVVISGMTISNGRNTNFGGGILSRSRLTLVGLHVTGNTASLGGGVFLADAGGVLAASTLSANVSTGDGGGLFFEGNNGDTLAVSNSTISGNHSAGNSGGIRTTRGQVQVTTSTVVGNTAAGAPGGILAIAVTAGNTSTINLRNTIVAGNAPNNLAAISVGGAASVQTLGFNLSDDYNGVFAPLASDITNSAPRLAPLAPNGGTTPTHALLHGSPAINAGDATNQPTDQRGVARVFGTSADIGSVEMRPRVVTNANDSGAGSLRDAISASNVTNDLDDILFDSTFFNTQRTVTLTSGQLVLSSPINVIAPGANVLTVSGNNTSRVFQADGAATATLSGLTISGGLAEVGGGVANGGRLAISHTAIVGNTAAMFGGGIFATGGAVTTVAGSTVSGNTANSELGTGAGIDHVGTLTVTDSTISGNSAPNGDGNGGGVLVNGSARFVNTTITNNATVGAGSAGGVFALNSSVAILRNSIVARNTAALRDVASPGFASGGFNLVGNPGSVTAFNQIGDQVGTSVAPLNPLLGPLQNNGGTTATHALLVGSPALDKGERSGTNVDQRGLPRQVDLASIANAADGADIGALEAQIVPLEDNIFGNGFE